MIDYFLLGVITGLVVVFVVMLWLIPKHLAKIRKLVVDDVAGEH